MKLNSNTQKSRLGQLLQWAKEMEEKGLDRVYKVLYLDLLIRINFLINQKSKHES